MSKKYIILLSVLVLISITILGIIVVNKTSDAMKIAISYGTVASIHSALITELSKENTELDKIFDRTSEHWQTLPKELYNNVISELSKFHNLDTPKNWDTSTSLLDSWGNRFQIICRSKDKTYEFIVISKGSDRICNTNDDIVINKDKELWKAIQIHN